MEPLASCQCDISFLQMYALRVYIRADLDSDRLTDLYFAIICIPRYARRGGGVKEAGGDGKRRERFEGEGSEEKENQGMADGKERKRKGREGKVGRRRIWRARNMAGWKEKEGEV